jgi:hypothetical protein
MRMKMIASNFIVEIEFISFILTVYGVIAIAIPKIHGLVVLSIASITWAVFGYLTGNVFLLLQNLFLLVIDCFAIYNWNKKGIGS